MAAVTVKDAYPPPCNDRVFSAADWFSRLDLASGYWQSCLCDHIRTVCVGRYALYVITRYFLAINGTAIDKTQVLNLVLDLFR